MKAAAKHATKSSDEKGNATVATLVTIALVFTLVIGLAYFFRA